jgi:hypothetical protein
MNRHAWPGLTWGCPYPAVGILVFLMPAEVRRYFMMHLLVDVMRAERLLQSFALRLKQNYPRT